MFFQTQDPVPEHGTGSRRTCEARGLTTSSLGRTGSSLGSRFSLHLVGTSLGSRLLSGTRCILAALPPLGELLGPTADASLALVATHPVLMSGVATMRTGLVPISAARGNALDLLGDVVGDEQVDLVSGLGHQAVVPVDQLRFLGREARPTTFLNHLPEATQHRVHLGVGTGRVELVAAGLGAGVDHPPTHP